MDFNERVIPGVSANFLYREALARYEFALQFIKHDKKVLDLACGTGYGSALLAKTNSVVGVDRDREAIAFARKHFGKDVQFVIGDVEKGNKNLGKFDAICAFEIIEHLEKPETFLKNAFQLLKSNGIMILSTPNAEIPVPPNSTKSKYHTKEFTRKEFEHILKKTFKNVQILGQVKDAKAKKAFEEFMKSQSARQTLVNHDRFNVRQYIPKEVKEKIWKYGGALFGRKVQDSLNTKNFPITKRVSESTEYFVTLCRK